MSRSIIRGLLANCIIQNHLRRTARPEGVGNRGLRVISNHTPTYLASAVSNKHSVRLRTAGASRSIIGNSGRLAAIDHWAIIVLSLRGSQYENDDGR